MLVPLQYLKHTIRCAYGQSSMTYGTDYAGKPMQGVYQGNGAGPIIWAVVSSPTLQILDGFGTFFQMAISQQQIRIVGYAFVDNTDLIQTSKDGQTFVEVNKEMQNAMNLWEGLIKIQEAPWQQTNVDGGALTLYGMTENGDTKQKRSFEAN